MSTRVRLYRARPSTSPENTVDVDLSVDYAMGSGMRVAHLSPKRAEELALSLILAAATVRKTRREAARG